MFSYFNFLAVISFTVYFPERHIMDSRITIAELLAAKRKNHKIAAISCYDYSTARLISQTGVQMILVGDSAAQVVLGFGMALLRTTRERSMI